MYLEFKRHSGISLSTGDLAVTAPGGGGGGGGNNNNSSSGGVLLPVGVSTSSLDSSTRSRKNKKPTIDRTIKPMSNNQITGSAKLENGTGKDTLTIDRTMKPMSNNQITSSAKHK